MFEKSNGKDIEISLTTAWIYAISQTFRVRFNKYDVVFVKRKSQKVLGNINVKYWQPFINRSEVVDTYNKILKMVLSYEGFLQELGTDQ